MSTPTPGPTFDLVLFGFRNDLARAQTLAFLRGLPPTSPPMLFERDTSVPRRLFAALELSHAQSLLAQLERFGAQVALLPVDPQAPPSEAASAPLEFRKRSIGGRLLSGLMVIAAIAAIYVAPATEHWHHVVRRARLPAAPLLEPVQPEAPVGQPAAARLNNDAVQLGAARQFREAVERLEAALRLAPGDPTLTQNLQAMLFNWGVSDLNAGQLDDAMDHLRRAKELGDRLEVWRALGIAYLRPQRYDAPGGALH